MLGRTQISTNTHTYISPLSLHCIVKHIYTTQISSIFTLYTPYSAYNIIQKPNDCTSDLFPWQNPCRTYSSTAPCDRTLYWAIWYLYILNYIQRRAEGVGSVCLVQTWLCIVIYISLLQHTVILRWTHTHTKDIMYRTQKSTSKNNI